MRRKMYLLAGGPGGSRRTAEQLKAALQECGTAHPSIAYIGTASDDDRAFMNWFVRPLVKAGASAVTLAPLAGRHADEAKAAAVLRSSDAVFISGGEVEDGIRALSPAIRSLLKELLESGTVFIGLSAGTIMQGKAWPHWPDEDAHPENAVLFDCLGFADTIFDTHAESEGWPELRKAVELAGDGFVGYGIPSGEMAVIDEQGILIPNPNLVRCCNEGGSAVIR